MLAASVLLLTGSPGIGKTTVIRRVAEQIKDRRLGGFYTEEIREAVERRGFRLLGFDGTETVIAHVGFPRRYSVGKYGVDVGAIDAAVSLLALDAATDCYLVDEIGKMECLSERFVEAMRGLLNGPAPMIATVALRGSGFIAEAKASEGVTMWRLTEENRDDLPNCALRWLEAVGLA